MLDEKYRIERLLAVGGMGAVYIGTHMLLRKRVAIKLLRPDLASCYDAIERFHREAIAASQIGHDNICEVTDLGRTPWGAAFLVMEFLDGKSLDTLLKERERLEPAEACDIVLQILSAISAAHARGIVHRDLKPANVFLAERVSGRRVKILDFGISRIQGPDNQDLRLTQTGAVLGTPAYMSPEQASGHVDVGTASDLYSIGVILYELLTGRLPYTDTNYNKLMFKVVAGKYPRPRSILPSLPRALEEVVVRAMAGKPEERFATAEEFGRALVPYTGAPAPAFVMTTDRRIPSGIGAASSPPSARFATDATLISDKHSPPSDSTRPRVVTAESLGATQVATHPPNGTTMTHGAGQQITHPTSNRRLGLVATGAVALAVGAAAVFMVLRTASDEPVIKVAPEPVAAHTTSPIAPPTPLKPEVKPAPPPLPERIRLSLAVTPAEAEVLIDGVVIADRKLERDRDDKDHQIEIRAAGFSSVTETIRFDEHQRLTYVLEKQPAEVVEPRPKRPRRDSKTTPTDHRTRIMDESPYGGE